MKCAIAELEAENYKLRRERDNLLAALTEKASFMKSRDARIRAESIAAFWQDLKETAEEILDNRLALMSPVTTYAKANTRTDITNGWSAWLLAKHLINGRIAIAENGGIG